MSNREGPPLRRVVMELRYAGAILSRTSGGHQVWTFPSGLHVSIPAHGRHVSRNVYATVRRALSGRGAKVAGTEVSHG